MGPATLLFLQCKDSLGAHSKRRLIAHLGIGRAGYADREVTHIKWRYEFTAKGRVTAVLLSLVVRTQWAGYMRVCLENTRRCLRNAGNGTHLIEALQRTTMLGLPAMSAYGT
jgi:hypothetical protein